MTRRCDVAIVGGGPAGSSCARVLAAAGLDVVVADKAVFPRDKVCAGWITPDVVEALALDLADYAAGRTLQPVLGFETGIIGGHRVTTRYAEPVSYAIRRCEFDTYLLRRCGAEVIEGTAVEGIERTPQGWALRLKPAQHEEPGPGAAGRATPRPRLAIAAPVLVGAGGHFCPVARWLNPSEPPSPTLVVAQELELRLEAPPTSGVAPELPALYFCRDLRGYGWCVRKGEYLNVGFGRQDADGFAEASRAFLAWLRSCGRIPAGFPDRWHGHAYRVWGRPVRRVASDGVLLVGDAAGLAYPASGEGIHPAVVSGQLAARHILGAASNDPGGRLDAYVAALERAFGVPSATGPAAWPLPPRLYTAIGRALIAQPWFARRHLVERSFLRRRPRASRSAPTPPR